MAYIPATYMRAVSDLDDDANSNWIVYRRTSKLKTRMTQLKKWFSSKLKPKHPWEEIGDNFTAF
jgi:hypothetical protein